MDNFLCLFRPLYLELKNKIELEQTKGYQGNFTVTYYYKIQVKIRIASTPNDSYKSISLHSEYRPTYLARLANMHLSASGVKTL